MVTVIKMGVHLISYVFGHIWKVLPFCDFIPKAALSPWLFFWRRSNPQPPVMKYAQPIEPTYSKSAY